MTTFRIRSDSRRDQSNDFLPPRVNDNKAPPESVHTKGDVTLLLVHRVVQDRDRHIIEQNRCGVSKIDTVFPKVGVSFALVPLQLHGLMICTCVHTVKR